MMEKKKKSLEEKTGVSKEKEKMNSLTHTYFFTKAFLITPPVNISGSLPVSA